MVQTNEVYNYSGLSRSRFEGENKKVLFFRRKVFWMILLLIGFLMLVLSPKVFIFVPLVILHSIVSWIRSKSGLGWLGVELIMFNTVLAGVLLGALGGMLMAVICLFINYVLSKKYVGFIMITLPLYLGIGALAAFLPIVNFVLWGILLVIAYNIISFVLSMMIGAKPFGLYLFSVTNILFNVLLFLRIGPLMLKLFGVQ